MQSLNVIYRTTTIFCHNNDNNDLLQNEHTYTHKQTHAYGACDGDHRSNRSNRSKRRRNQGIRPLKYSI